MKKPKISIIIPVYNHARELFNCLESVLWQSFQDFEVIVVDDGSQDNFLNAVEKQRQKFEFQNLSLKIIQQENRGSNAARNSGFQKSNGEYVIFLDADIMMKKDMLEKMLKALEENRGASYAYSSFKFGFKTFKLWKFDAEKLRQMPYIHTSSLIRREHFAGFDEKIKKFQDWDLWLGMLMKGYKGIWISENLFKIKPRNRYGISFWLPSFFYKIPWQKFGVRIKEVEKYKEATEIIKKKHHIRI
ncbi:glycosyltransferase family 2 protein [Candidatus Parcubacteria bacterium]|nr:glycosyltransferase family 2 protein [Candidatus Parcubacteria bacterium]